MSIIDLQNDAERQMSTCLSFALRPNDTPGYGFYPLKRKNLPPKAQKLPGVNQISVSRVIVSIINKVAIEGSNFDTKFEPFCMYKGEKDFDQYVMLSLLNGSFHSASSIHQPPPSRYP